MKIKSNLDDKLPLNKTKEIHSIIIVVRAVCHEDNKYYPQVFLWHIMILLTLLKELMLINMQIKCVRYLSMLVFLDKGFKFQPNVCN